MPVLFVTKEEFEALQRIFIRIQFAVDKGNQKLDALINDLRHQMNDDLIDLKYGKGYKASFMDDILIRANNL